MITVSDYGGALDALKHPALEQALYEAGARVMGGVLLTLHGEAHRRRRVAEYAVFKRDFFRTYETETFPRTLQPLLAEAVAARRVDLVDLNYRIVMNLTADFAGVDRNGEPEETECLLGLIKAFSAGATQAHARGDLDEINAEVDRAMTILESRFLTPSIERRGSLAAEGRPLPNDILSILLSRPDLELSRPQLRREIAFYLQAGAHSTANTTVHALNRCFAWIESGAATRDGLLDDPALLQRCVHETLRLHPASPVAMRRAREDLRIADRRIERDALVTIDLAAANRDASVFGRDADTFNPRRSLPPRVRLWGLSFGHGIHACMGRDLDGGVARSDRSGAPGQLGIVTLLVRAYLAQGAERIEDDPPTQDPTTQRQVFGRYPVRFRDRSGKESQ